MSKKAKLESLYNEIEGLKQKAGSNDSDFRSWHTAVEICLTELYGEKSIQVRNFKNRHFSAMVYVSGGPDYSHKYYMEGLETTKKEFERYLCDLEEVKVESTPESKSKNKVFIIHGHDEKLKLEVARLIEQQGIEAIILSEQVNQGRTVIEKIEAYSDVSVAVALFTKDDSGNVKGTTTLNDRARQNVVFETGFFIGLLQRKNVVIIAEEGVEIPSDLADVVYTSKEHWKFEVLKELSAAGLNVDLNKLL